MVRITADCPLIDPEIIDSAVALFRGRDVDYASNVLPGRRTYPRGLDVEVVSRVALARVARSTNEPRHRSHVTLYIREEPEQFSVASLEQEKDLSHDRWTVDELPDLEFVRDVYRSLGDRNAFGWHEVKDLVAGRPDLLLVNRNVRQKALHEL
jgi:spore coat polysaccharide biosynthesis protein SpsF